MKVHFVDIYKAKQFYPTQICLGLYIEKKTKEFLLKAPNLPSLRKDIIKGTGE